MHWVREANLEHRIEKIIALKYNRLVRKAKYLKKPLDPKIVNTTEQIEPGSLKMTIQPNLSITRKYLIFHCLIVTINGRYLL